MKIKLLYCKECGEEVYEDDVPRGAVNNSLMCIGCGSTYSKDELHEEGVDDVKREVICEKSQWDHAWMKGVKEGKVMGAEVERKAIAERLVTIFDGSEMEYETVKKLNGMIATLRAGRPLLPKVGDSDYRSGHSTNIDGTCNLGCC